ncbi:MAG: tetratricopeptide repeat protein [Planctomycetes bacterium]|nr:tetratricopeptide repeat protein [Planctomycetota bacterium]
MKLPDAETAYLFRHAVLRDAAYQLQTVGDRAALHGLAFHLIEQAFGGRAPQPDSLEARGVPRFQAHPIDHVAAELAWHALQAGQQDSAMRDLASLYLHRSAEYSGAQYQTAGSAAHWLALAKLLASAGRAEAMRRAAEQLCMAGNVPQGESILDQALLVAMESGEHNVQGSILAELAGVYEQTGRSALSDQTYQRAIACLRLARNHYRLAATEVNLAILCTQTGQMQRAEQLFAQSTKALSEYQDYRGRSAALQSYATMLDRIGQTAQAGKKLEEAIEMQRLSGDERREASLKSAIGASLKRQGDFAGAEQAYTDSLALHLKHGDRRMEGYAHGSLAALYAGTGRAGLAEQAYVRSLAALREVGDLRAEGTQLSNLASLYHQTGRLDLAAVTLEQALSIHRQVGNRRMEGTTLGNLALLAAARGRLQQAQPLFDQAVAVHREVSNVRMEGRQWCEYAIALVLANRADDAARCWKTGMELMLAHDDHAEAKALMKSMRESCARAGMHPLPGGPQ